MIKFESELNKGNFVISICKKCKKAVWPPSEICDFCFSNVEWEKTSGFGILTEFSKTNEKLFGIVELDEKIRIVANLENTSKPIKIGQKVTLKRCSFENGNYVFTFTLI